MELKKCPICKGVIERHESETYVCACCEAVFGFDIKRGDINENKNN